VQRLAVLAMVFVPCINVGYVLLFFAADFRINMPQLILNVSFGALLGSFSGRFIATRVAACTMAALQTMIRIYDEAGNVIETQEHIGHFKEP
jgi:hypothetical protein